jgi:redox-sensing transcriptional repressor
MSVTGGTRQGAAYLGRLAKAEASETPEVVVNRLPHYLRILNDLARQNVEVVSSQQLAQRLGTSSAQIRKDLSYFGRFGKQGRGYNVRRLADELRRILCLNRDWNMAVVGVGRLGRAIIGYPGFAPEGFRVVAALDADPRQVGQAIGGLIVHPMSELESVLRQKDVRIAIVAVPAAQAQQVIDQLVRAGVRAILNYAPVPPHVPNGVKERSIDPVLALQSMTFYVGQPPGSTASTRPKG